MSTLSGFIDCPNAQISLLNAWNYDNLGSQMNDINILRMLMSETNRRDVIQNLLNTHPHGLRSVEVIYSQRRLVSEVGDEGCIQCDTQNPQGETSKIYDIDPCVGARAGFSVLASDLQRRCEEEPLYIGRELAKTIDVVARKVEKDAAISMIANTGNFSSDVDEGNPAGTTSIFLTKTKKTDGTLLYDAFEDVNFEMIAANGFSNIIVFGGEPWYKNAKAIQAACCNDLGFDAGLYASQNPYRFAYAREIQLNAGLNDAIAIAAGSVQLLHYNEFRGTSANNPWVMDDDQLKQGTIMHPELPLAFDYRAKYNCEGGAKTWDFEVALAYTFAYMPDDMYQVGDRMEGVNGVNRFRINNV